MTQRVLITRPAHQATPLAQAIKKAGGEVLLFPTIEILPAELAQKTKDKLEQINDYDIVIFISPNAVEHGLRHIQTIKPIANHVLLATVGQGSADLLKKILGKSPDIVPEKIFSSEGLLATKSLQNVENKRFLIIRGNGGRELLKQTLEQRGAQVDAISVYQRIKPETSTDELEQYLQNKQIAAIVITSGENLKNLMEMVPKNVRGLLLQIPLILINKRLLKIAEQTGFTNKCFIALSANDEAIVEMLLQNNLLTSEIK